MQRVKLFHLLIKTIGKFFNFIAIFLIKFYQLLISPILPSSCRHIPSCSNYALSAYKKYDFFAATFLSTKRILRCNPFFKGGYDPLPENFSFKKIISFKKRFSRSVNG